MSVKLLWYLWSLNSVFERTHQSIKGGSNISSYTEKYPLMSLLFSIERNENRLCLVTLAYTDLIATLCISRYECKAKTVHLLRMVL